MLLKQLIGHISPETAFVVEDYPYGFRLRTQIRYWIETTRRGQRFMSQTLNPKNGRWNQPKASTYSDVMVLVQEDDTGHIRYSGVSKTSGRDWIVEFEGKYQLDAWQTAQLEGIKRFNKIMESVTWKIAPGPTLTV